MMAESNRTYRREQTNVKRTIHPVLLEEMEKIFPSPELNGRVLYHYTAQKGLIGIAETRKLWMTSILHMNDSTEFNYPLQLVREKIETKQKEKKEANYQAFLNGLATGLDTLGSTTRYVACFCEDDGDSLNQWRGYGDGGAGFSVGFKDVSLNRLAIYQNHRLAPCIYERQVQDDIIDKIFATMDSKITPDEPPPHAGFFIILFLRFSALIKHPAFKEEREWRVISDIESLYNPAEFRGGKFTLIPYRELSLQLAGSEHLSISDLVVGPNPHKILSLNSTMQFEHTMKLGESVNVRSSEVPYRAL